jgi:AraC-like DNA-binding protein
MKDIPEFINCVLIDRKSNKKQSHLPHVHNDFLELFYVCSGEGQYMVNNRSYTIKAGDIVICNAGVIHGEEPELVKQIYSYSIALSNIKLNKLPPNTLTGEDENPVISCGNLSTLVEQLMHLLHLLSLDPEHLKETCDYLAGSMYSLTTALLESRARHETALIKETPSALARRARHYLNAHYFEPLTLHEIAERLNVNEYYLSHVFKEEYGIPPMKYVIKRRIGEAQDLLMHKSMPVAEIADSLGYSSVCHFNSMFKKYVGMSPGQYRKSFRHDDEPDEHA